MSRGHLIVSIIGRFSLSPEEINRNNMKRRIFFVHYKRIPGTLGTGIGGFNCKTAHIGFHQRFCNYFYVGNKAAALLQGISESFGMRSNEARL